MVILHVKKGDSNLFLYETTLKKVISEVKTDLVSIHNGRLNIERLCYEIDQLAKHGVCLPPKMQGLTSNQISELKLKDEWTNKNKNSLDYISNPDPMSMRNGLAPSKKFSDILTKTTAEAKTRISEKMIERKVCFTKETIEDTLVILDGAVKICYPMGLPPYEPVLLEIGGKRDLTGTQASKEILDENSTDLWWASKNLDTEKCLSDYAGKNEKSKLIVKLQKMGQGAPSREPAMTEGQRKELMLAEFHRREELKKLEEDDDDSYLDNKWADNRQMKRNIMGLANIKFK